MDTPDAPTDAAPETPDNPQAKILLAFGMARIAAHFGIYETACRKWLRPNGIPAERVPELAFITGKRPHDLRPDLYHPDDRGPPMAVVRLPIPARRR